MTEEQIREAIEQVKVHCDLLMETYEMVSMRGALYTLGFDVSDADEILGYVADRGFNYCLDSHVKSVWFDSHRQEKIEDYPSPDVCVWGPDQLKSRLECLR